MTFSPRVIEGITLHSGAPARLTISHRQGPLVLSDGAALAPREALRVTRCDQGVAVRLGPDGPQIDLVEHLFAAIGALSLTRDVCIEIHGGEVPLADGGALAFARALPVPATSPRPPIRRPFTFEHRGASYRLAPGSDVCIDVHISFDHPMLRSGHASFHGDPDDFVARIAPARTFGFARDAAALLARGRARAVDPRHVVIFTDDGLLDGCHLDGDDEPARHKLLDLIGDLALHGGPFCGILEAHRPGHEATHAMVAAARRAGAL